MVRKAGPQDEALRRISAALVNKHFIEPSPKYLAEILPDSIEDRSEDFRMTVRSMLAWQMLPGCGGVGVEKKMARKQGQGAVSGLGRIREGVSGRFARLLDESGRPASTVNWNFSLFRHVLETLRNLDSGVRAASKSVAHHARCC